MIEMNPQNEINPEKTYALVVGVEKYQEGAKNLNGPARDAVQFAIWLLSKNVNPNNIGLFISPLEEENIIQEAQEQEEKFNQIPRKSATFENIESFIDQQLHNQNQSGELLYVFWSGHGLITPSQEQTETRLLFSDFSNSSPRNLNLSSLVNALKSPQKHQGFSRQIYLIDACADVYISNQFQVKEMRFSPFGMKDKLQPRPQYILFSVTEGATPINKKSEGGSFSKAIFEELKDQPLLPDMDRVSTKVINKREIDGMNPTFWKRDWDGNDENNLGSLLSDSDSPTPEEQKNAVLNFLEKIEEKCKDIKLFHLEQKIPLTQQYIPIQVTLERRYKKLTENIGSYAESEAEWKQIHALKPTIYQYKKQQLDWEKARKEHQKIMVLADPGMGKSTLLKMEALRIAKDQREKLETGTITVEEVVLPLFLRLSELASEQNKSEFLPEAIADVIKQIYPDKTECEKIQPLIVEKIKKGQCFLLLDAWDEVQQDNRTNLKTQLGNLKEKEIDFPIIATSRIVGYTGSPIGGAKEVEIIPFDQQQTENYIKTWFKNAKRYLEDESVSAENLIKELQDRPQINELVKNPLLLSLICSLYQTKKLELPTKRSEIYKQAVDCILQKWRNQRKEQKTVEIDFKKEVLESFAYQISREGKEVFNLRELRKKIQSFLQKEGYQVDSMAIITELSEEDGIIQQIDKDGEKYIFLHRTFQEYFTASYLNQSEDTLSLAEQFFWNYDQHETLTLLAGLMDDPTCLIEDIYTREDDIFKTPLLLAGRCLAECSNQALEPSLTTDIVENLHQFWLSYPDASFINSTVVTLAKVNSEAVKPLIAALHHSYLYVRSSAVEVLGHIGNGEALKALIAALHHSEYHVRRSAVEALGKIGNGEAVQPLIAALHDSDYWVRRSAVHALCQIGNAEAVQLFTAALDDPDYNLRKYAVEALGEIGNAEAVKPLIAALNHSDSYVRRYAAFGLGKIGNGEAVKPLIAALDDSDHYVRREVAIALGQIGNAEVLKALITALHHSDSNVRSYAAEALGKIGNAEAVQPLIAALDDPDSFVRRYAVEALCKIGNAEAVQPLIAALDDPYVLVRRYAVEALGKIGNAEAVQPLIAALDDSDKDVRRSAVHALGEIGNAEAVQPLIATLHHSDSLVRWSAVHALGKIGNAEAVQPLIAALHDPNSNVREYAVFALGKIGNAEALKALIAALNHSDSNVRRYAVLTLGEIGNAEALKALIAALDHPDSDVRRFAAFALGKIGNAEAVKPLIAALHDCDDDVRRDAIEALGKIGNSEALKALIAAPNHSDFYMYVIMYPVEALGKIGNAEVVKALIAALHDSDLYVRRNAASALGEIGNAEAVEALIAALHDSDIFLVRKFAAYALGEIGTAEVLEQLLQDPKVKIYKPELFYMARRIAIRFSQKNYEFIPVYPKYVKSGN